jgi:hypothetical protein
VSAFAETGSTRIARKASAFRPVMDSAVNEVRLLFSYTFHVGHRDDATDGSSLFGNLRYVVLFKRWADKILIVFKSIGFG